MGNKHGNRRGSGGTDAPPAFSGNKESVDTSELPVSVIMDNTPADGDTVETTVGKTTDFPEGQ